MVGEGEREGRKNMRWWKRGRDRQKGEIDREREGETVRERERK